MDSIDIQQLNNNNFTNTQYGKFQRISYIISSQTEPSGHLPVQDRTNFGSIYFKRLIFNFSWWKHNRYQY